MTHPTYTHPGANAAMLAISRAKRQLVICNRAHVAWKNTSMEDVCARHLNRAGNDLLDAWGRLAAINAAHLS